MKYIIALSQQVQNMYGMLTKYVTSRLGCLGLPVAANSPLNSMGIYTAFDRTLLPRIGDLPNVHTDLKFQNQAIQCCLFEPSGVKYDRAVGRERATSILCLRDYARVLQYKLNYLDPSLKNHVSYSKLPT